MIAVAPKPAFSALQGTNRPRVDMQPVAGGVMDIDLDASRRIQKDWSGPQFGVVDQGGF